MEVSEAAGGTTRAPYRFCCRNYLSRRFVRRGKGTPTLRRGAGSFPEDVCFSLATKTKALDFAVPAPVPDDGKSDKVRVSVGLGETIWCAEDGRSGTRGGGPCSPSRGASGDGDCSFCTRRLAVRFFSHLFSFLAHA